MGQQGRTLGTTGTYIICQLLLTLHRKYGIVLGVTITKSGLLAAAHLVGAFRVMSAIQDNREIADANEILHALKEKYSLRQLERVTGISRGVIHKS